MAHPSRRDNCPRQRAPVRQVGTIMLFFLFSLISVSSAFADSGGRSAFLANLGQGISKTADERYQNRWTIADWFETQRKTRLQDMWLAENRKDDLYQFMIGGRTGLRTDTVNEVESVVRPRQTAAQAAAYATFVGLEGGYTDTENDSYGWDAAFAIRLLGDALQNTNLTAAYGVRFREDTTGERIQSPAPRVGLTIYINRAFGIEGQYQWHLSEKSNRDVEISGSLVEGGAFIDFSFLRIFGMWSRETRERVGTKRVREGVDVGLKAFF